MLSVIRQEFYKLRHQTSFWVFTLVVFVMPLLFSFAMSLIGSRTVAQNASTFLDYNGMFDLMITIFMIIEYAQTISSEFQYDTIKVQVAKGNSRSAIFFGKMGTLKLVILFWMLLGIIASALSAFLFGYLDVDKNLIIEIVINQIPTFLTVLLLGGIVVLFSSLLTSNAIAITLGFVSWLAGQTINAFAMEYLYKPFPFIKFNPFNILTFLPLQFNDDSAIKISHLSNPEMYTSWFIWVIVLYGIAYMSFKRRDL